MSVETIWPNQDYESMVQYYGEVGENQVILELPYEMRLSWSPSERVRKIKCHLKVQESIHSILQATLSLYSLPEIQKLRLDVYGGCLNVRKKRGGTTWSIHSWGAALDIDPDRNQLKWHKDKATLAGPDYEPFWEIVAREGWTSLGKSRDYDWMHFQAADLA